MNRQEFELILGPGLSDRVDLVGGLIPQRLPYKDAAVNIHFHPAPWKTDPDDLYPKLDGLVDKIDSLNGANIVLVGISGSGSLMLNGFAERNNKVSKVITVCSRLREGRGDFPPLYLSAKKSAAFFESVLLAQTNAATFTEEEKAKFLTISAAWDEMVPPSTSTLEGATNIKIPVPEHAMAIAVALTVYRKKWLDFILK